MTNGAHSLDARYERLQEIVRETGGLLVAFSGGLDSTFLAAVAHDLLGDRALAVTAVSPLYPEHERQEAIDVARLIGIQHELVESNELEIPEFADNPPDRCYYCKHELFSLLKRMAADHGLPHVADGSNRDDRKDHRPGTRAARELGILSPLDEAGMDKQDIRALSRQRNLPTAEKPPFACLASRVPYGDPITLEKLQAVQAVESALRQLGFRQFRVRCHDVIARIEVDRDALSRLADPALREAIAHAGRKAGFRFVTIDLEGYRTGSMNPE